MHPRKKTRRKPRQKITDITNVSLPTEGFVRIKTVLAVYPISRAAWWAGIKAGRYPKPVKLGPNTTAWKASEIRALIERAS